MTFFSHPSVLSLYPVILTLAFLLDLVIGDPRWLPHPVRIIGSAITGTELFMRRHFRSPRHEKMGGVLLVVLVVVPVFAVSFLLERTMFSLIRPSILTVASVIGLTVLVYITSTTIAVRELIDSATVVIASVRERNIDSARKNLSMIVGRDTHNLNEKGVLKAAMETLAENLSDGVVAPLLYLALGGLPLAMAYKAVNTLDSMVGYRNKQYLHFGRAAARLDDIANYVPARITGVLIVIASTLLSFSLSTFHYSLKTMLRDGRKHLSPNSGVPEAAMAGALGVRMGGPSTYGGMVVEKPCIGDERPDTENRSQNTDELYFDAAETAVEIAKVASLLGIIMASAILYIRTSS